MTTYSFNYSLMQILCQELRESILQFKVIACLPDNLHRFFLIFEGQEQQIKTLFFCFESPFIRFHLTQKVVSTHSHSIHPLSSFLQEAILKSIDLLQQDRILQLVFSTSKGECLLIAEFFTKHPNYYLLRPDKTILFALHSSSNTHYQLPSPYAIQADASLWFNHQEVETAYLELEKQEKFNREKHHLQKQLTKKIKKINRKKEELLESLKACLEWPSIQHQGNLIKTHLTTIKKGTSSWVVHDWATDQPYHLKLDPSKTAHEQMCLFFKRAKKLQAGQIPLNHYLDRIQTELSQLNQHLYKLNQLITLEELVTFKKALALSFDAPSSKTPSKKISTSIYREYQSNKGIKIWVGKNAKSNDHLTFQLANGRDWWMHVSGFSGSHVIIRLSKNQEPDSETFKDALQLALHYSKARTQGEGEIVFTQRKYVTRLGRRKTGLVQISKHQSTWTRLDPARFQSLKERSLQK